MLLALTRGLVNVVMIIFLTETQLSQIQYELFLRFMFHSHVTLFFFVVCFLFNFLVRNSFFSIYKTI